MPILNLPNSLTLLRIILIPFFLVFLLLDKRGWALATFVTAGLTDAVDGAVARLMDKKTQLGVLLDPIADKMLVVAAFLALTYLHRIPLWLTLTVLVRDLIIVSGSIVLYRMGYRMDIKPLITGKITTFLLLALLVVAMLGYYMERELELGVYLIWLSMFFVLVSGAQYLFRGWKIINGRPAGGTVNE